MTIFDLCSAAADGHAYVCSSFIWFQEQSIDHHSDRRAPLFLLFYKTPVNEMMIMCCILDETKRKMDDDDVYTIISYNIIFFQQFPDIYIQIDFELGSSSYCDASKVIP